MFVLVEALKQEGLLAYIADGLTAALRFVDFNVFATVFLVGTCSVLLCSVLVKDGLFCGMLLLLFE